MAKVASRRVLENGFELVAVRPVATEPGDRPMAIYRLPGAFADGGSGAAATTRYPEPRAGSV